MWSAIAGMNSSVEPSDHPRFQSPCTDESPSHSSRELRPLDRITFVKRTHVSELPHFFWKHLSPSAFPEFPFLPSALFPKKRTARTEHSMKDDRAETFSRKEDEERKSRNALEGTCHPSLGAKSFGFPILHSPFSWKVDSSSDMDDNIGDGKEKEEYGAWNHKPQQEEAHSFQQFLLPPGRCCHTMDAYQNRYLVVFGGGSPSWNVGEDVWVYDLRTHQWFRHPCNGEGETNDRSNATQYSREKDKSSSPYSGTMDEKREEESQGRWVGPKEIDTETPNIPTTSLAHFHPYPENFLPRALERNNIENTNALSPSSAPSFPFSPPSYRQCRSFIYSYSFSTSSEASPKAGRISSYPFPFSSHSSLLSSAKSLPNAKNVHPPSRIIHSSCIYKDFLIIYGGHGLGSVDVQEMREQAAADHDNAVRLNSSSSPLSFVPVRGGHSSRSSSSSREERSAVSHDIPSHPFGRLRDSEGSEGSTVSIRSTELTRHRSPNLSVSSPSTALPSESGLLDDMFVLDLQQWKWRNLGHVPAAPHGPGAREYHTAHIHKERMYVVMGFTEEDEEEEEEEEELQEVNDMDTARECGVAPVWLTPGMSEEQNESEMQRHREVNKNRKRTEEQAEENDEGLQTSPHLQTTDHLKESSSFCMPSVPSFSSSFSRSIPSSRPLVWYLDLHAGTWHPAEPMFPPKPTPSASSYASFPAHSDHVIDLPSSPPSPTTVSTSRPPTIHRTASPTSPITPLLPAYRKEKRLPMGSHSVANADYNDEAPKKCLGGHTAAAEKGKIYIFGGTTSRKRWDSHQYSNQLYIFHLHTHRWQSVRVKASQPSPPPRYGAALAVKDGVVYVFGGDRPEERLVLGDFWRIDTEAAEPEWEEMKVLPTTTTISVGENDAKENEESIEDEGDRHRDTLTPEEVRRTIEIPTERRRHHFFPADDSTTVHGGVPERHPFPSAISSVSLRHPEGQQREEEEEEEEAFAFMREAKKKELLVPYSLHNLERPMPRTGVGYTTVSGNLYIMGGESVTLARSRTVSPFSSFSSHSSPQFSHSTTTTTASHGELFEIETDNAVRTAPSRGITCGGESFPFPPPTSSLLPQLPRGLPSSIQHQLDTEVVYSNDLYMYPLGMSTSLTASTYSTPVLLAKARRNGGSPCAIWEKRKKGTEEEEEEVNPMMEDEEQKVPLLHVEGGGSSETRPHDNKDGSPRSRPWRSTTSDSDRHPTSSPSWVEWSLETAKELEKEKDEPKVVPRTLLESAACWISGSWTQMERSGGPAVMWSEIAQTCKTEPWSTLMALTTCVPSRLLFEE